MKLTYKVFEHPNFIDSLSKLLDLDLLIKQSVQLAKSIDTIVAEQGFYNKKKQSFFDKWGAPVEGRPEVSIKPENLEVFFKNMEELHAIEFEIALENKVVLPVSTPDKPLTYKAKDFYPILCMVEA